MADHARYSPSKLTRIVTCPGSVDATLDKEQRQTDVADEGTMLHSVTSYSLDSSDTTVSERAIKKFNLKEKEHIDAVQDCLDWVSGIKLKYAGEEWFEGVEHRVSLAPYVAKTACDELVDVEGTMDYSLAFPSLGILYVVDWKFGKGVEVYPDCEQLFAYALGRLATITDWKRYTEIVLVIGQPRLYNGECFKEHHTTAQELFAWLKEALIPALINSQSKHPKFNPSSKGCMWCAIKATCVHRHAAATAIACKAFEVFVKLPNEITMEELAEFLDGVPQLETYLSDIQKFATHLIQNGTDIPGYKMVAGRSTRKWLNEEYAKEYLAANDVDAFEIKFRSPAQVEKVLGKKNMTEDILKLIHKPEGSPTLVKATDKRPALSFTSVTDKFKEFVE